MSSNQTPAAQRFTQLMPDWRNGDRPVCVVCLGDSVTSGFTSAGVFDHEQVYHARLKRMLNRAWPGTLVNVLNAGVGGGNAGPALERLERDVLVHKPDVVTIAFGLNDSAGAEPGIPVFKQALTDMIGRCREAGVRWIVLVTPPMMCTADNPFIEAVNRHHLVKFAQRQNSGMLGRYAQAVRDVGAQSGVAVADVYARWEALARQGVNTNLMLANGLNHPDGASHQIHADALFEALSQL